MESIRKVHVLELPVWHVTVDRLCELIVEWADRHEGHWIATLNLDYVSRCARDPEFHALLSKADVFTADGAPVLRACRKIDPAYEGLERCTGADLTPRLISMVEPGKVAIVGGEDPGAALRKIGKDPADYFIFDGKVELNSEWASQLASQIGSRPIVFVALGCPKQEKMIELLRPHLPNAVFVAVGGSFEMMAGIKKRAPLWMQKSGMEWLFRLAIEPKRLWRRYLVEGPPGMRALQRTVKAARRTASNKLPPA